MSNNCSKVVLFATWVTLNEGLEHAGTWQYYLVTSTPFHFNIPPSRYVTFIARFAQVISAQPAYARLREDVEGWFTWSETLHQWCIFPWFRMEILRLIVLFAQNAWLARSILMYSWVYMAHLYHTTSGPAASWRTHMQSVFCVNLLMCVTTSKLLSGCRNLTTRLWQSQNVLLAVGDLLLT